ncbi:MAG: nodulation protein NfeD [Proteobacteria bacterium]|nr:nodulation protein NfeD [Pseudomonadota bacterium]MBU1056894.1 nodulation protein NfeD [Pseudomonadota bacterium]
MKSERSASLRTPFSNLKIVPLYCVLLLFSVLPPSPAVSETAVLLTIEGPIAGAVSDYVTRGLELAANEQAELVILELDTPGGLDVSMRNIIKAILNSAVPVVSYVTPEGARAASAGTYILYASHVAAMAPATNLGAATPVQIVKLPFGLDQNKPSGEEKIESAAGRMSPLQQKIINDAASYIKSLAMRNQRNQEWAEDAVRHGVSLNAVEALEKNVIDLIAVDMTDLLNQLHGREVHIGGTSRILVTQHLEIRGVEPDWRNRLLSVIADPNVAYLLLLIGCYGLILELVHPGFVLPGVVGAISLLLAFYAFQILPVNYSGLALIICGLVFMIAEAFVPSFGALGLGGIIAFGVGSVMLLDESSQRISVVLIIATALFSGMALFLLMYNVVRIRNKRGVCGDGDLIGSIGEAINDFDKYGNGRVWIHGESWRAVGSSSIQKGQKVRIQSRKGLEFEVGPV